VFMESPQAAVGLWSSVVPSVGKAEQSFFPLIST
jgi:hypothetical protein